jgi:hypothetical protein
MAQLYFYYNHSTVRLVQEYKYLGIIFTYNGKLTMVNLSMQLSN